MLNSPALDLQELGSKWHVLKKKSFLRFQVLIQAENLGVHYSFTVPKLTNEIIPLRHNYTWSVVLMKCSEPCAGGELSVL